MWNDFSKTIHLPSLSKGKNPPDVAENSHAFCCCIVAISWIYFSCYNWFVNSVWLPLFSVIINPWTTIIQYQYFINSINSNDCKRVYTIQRVYWGLGVCFMHLHKQTHAPLLHIKIQQKKLPVHRNLNQIMNESLVSPELPEMPLLLLYFLKNLKLFNLLWMRTLKSVMKFQYKTFMRHSALCLFIQYNTHYESGIIMTTEDRDKNNNNKNTECLPSRVS